MTTLKSTSSPIFILILFIIGTTNLLCQIEATSLLQKCISVHDPNGNWKKLSANFDISISRENTADRHFTIQLNLSKKKFQYSVQNDTIAFAQGFAQRKYYSRLNGNKEVTAEDVKKYDLSEARTQYLKEVYEYLLLLPMRLEHDGKYLDSLVQEVVFNDKPAYKITMNYEPVSKEDTWHFFIDKETYLLLGYQFYLIDVNTNGEYIYLDDYFTYNGIRIPKIKKWYWNKDKSFFRTDRIFKIYK